MLSLLVFRFVECAQAGWFLEVSSHGIFDCSSVAVTFEKDIVILGVRSISFGRPGASLWHPGSYFGRLRSPWVTIGAAGRTPRSPETHLSDLGMILGLRFGSLSGSDR